MIIRCTLAIGKTADESTNGRDFRLQDLESTADASIVLSDDATQNWAAVAIRDFKHGWPGGEAVAHFGGPRHVLDAALYWRTNTLTREVIRMIREQRNTAA